MKRVTLLIIALLLVAAFGLGLLYDTKLLQAQEKDSPAEVMSKLEVVIKNQEAILRRLKEIKEELDGVKKELDVVKVRASR